MKLLLFRENGCILLWPKKKSRTKKRKKIAPSAEKKQEKDNKKLDINAKFNIIRFHETDLSAFQKKASHQTRISRPQADEERPQGVSAPS
jgi:hypothetical protein